MQPSLHVETIAKRYGSVQALSRVSILANTEQVIGLVGHNGAGKSTLIKIIAGVTAPDAGQVNVNGVRVEDVQTARRGGVAVIYQDLRLFPNLTAAENIACTLQRGFAYSERLALAQAAKAIDQLNCDLPLTCPVSDLSVAQQQLVAIARALADESRVLILDEPTASLGIRESERLLQFLRELSRSGHLIIFVSHRLSEVRQLSDRLIVLRDGEVALDSPAGQVSETQLHSAMFGEAAAELSATSPVTAAPRQTAKPVLNVRHCSRIGEFEDVSFDVSSGEILGVAGLIGSGRSECAQAIAGLKPLLRGTVEVAGNRLPSGNGSAAVSAGLAYVPEDRLTQGLFPHLSVRSNLISACLARLATWGWISGTTPFTAALISAHGVRCPTADAPVSTLSGGNQQKVLLAKWLATQPRAIILDEPTAGVDVSAKAEMHTRIRRLAAAGMAVVMISSELDEILELSTRVLVLRRGKVVLDRARDELNRNTIIAHMLGTEASEPLRVANGMELDGDGFR